LPINPKPSRKRYPADIEQICVRLETGQAKAYQIANELSVHSSRVYWWYRDWRGQNLRDARAQTRRETWNTNHLTR
jgi:hypothetical protein